MPALSDRTFIRVETSNIVEAYRLADCLESRNPALAVTIEASVLPTIAHEMTPERFQRIGQLFNAALELTPAERDAYLLRACGQDADLREAVEKLLRHHSEGEEFLARPAMEIAATLLPQTPPVSLAGQTINHYEIVEKLGAGGMGEVWLALDSKLKRKVALKILPNEFATDPERLRRFETEAKAASATDHPNIVTIHEIGQSDGTYYFVQEYVEGETLRARIQRGPVALLETLDIARQTANALAAAHGSGVIHRDIKPENIMVRHDGFVKVLDFGLAGQQPIQTDSAHLSEAETLVNHTAPGVILGTVNYMSPEQTRGQKLDARSDLWSLGVVIYEMITGQRPFHGDSVPDIFVAILERQFVPLSSSVPETPQALEQILAKLLAKDRAQRHSSALQLADELKRLHHRLELDAERASGANANAPTQSIKLAIQTDKATAVRSTPLQPLPSNGKAFQWLRQRSAVTLVVAVILLAIAGAAALRYLRAPAISDNIDSIAVLPFQNLSQNPELAYLSDGLSQSLIDRLSELPQLKVIARNSSFKFREANIDLRKVASQLGVRAIVTGSVTQVGENLVIRFDIVDAAHDRQIAGGQYQRKADNLVQIQNELAQTASEKLRLKLTDSQSKRFGRNGTENSDAYRYYLTGLIELNGPQDIQSKALEYFEQAVKIDPDFAEAHAEIAYIYWLRSNGSDNPHELMPKTKAAIARAITIAPNLAKAHVLTAMVSECEYNFSNAEREYLRAIELSPNLDFARNNYAFFLSFMGRQEEALAQLEQQSIRDPINRRDALIYKGSVLTQARKFDEALKAYQEAQAVEAASAVPDVTWGYAYAGNKQYDLAVSHYKKAAALFGGDKKYSWPLVYLLATYAKIPAKHAEARATLKHIEATSGYTSPALMAAIYAALENNDKAMALLEQAYLTADPLLRYVGTGYEYDELRSDPRFVALTTKIGLTK